MLTLSGVAVRSALLCFLGRRIRRRRAGMAINIDNSTVSERP